MGAPEAEGCHPGQFSENCDARCIRQVTMVRMKLREIK
jgi:hypothetical protein